MDLFHDFESLKAVTGELFSSLAVRGSRRTAHPLIILASCLDNLYIVFGNVGKSLLLRECFVTHYVTGVPKAGIWNWLKVEKHGGGGGGVVWGGGFLVPDPNGGYNCD